MITITLKDISLTFEASPSVFSPHSVDAGTLAMLSIAKFNPTDKVLDLGCGYGVVGILAARMIGAGNVVMCDISQQAVDCAQQNAILNNVPDVDIRLSNGFEQLQDKTFTLVLSNPPYHADFSVPKNFIEGSFQRLVLGGKLIMVTKRLDWYKNKLISVFGGVQVHEIDGYYVFIAEKRRNSIQKKQKLPPKLSKKLQSKYKK